MNEFEYRIASDGRTIQVRVKYCGRGRYPAWGFYMTCDHEEQAERVLAMLQQADARIGDVVRE